MKKAVLIIAALLVGYLCPAWAQSDGMDNSPPVVSDNGDDNVPPSEDSQDEGEAEPPLDNDEDEPTPANDGGS